MYGIPFDRSFLQLSNGIRHVMTSTDRKLELTAKASMVQPVSQPAVCSNGLMKIVATCFGHKGPPFCPAYVCSTYTLGMVIQIGVAYRRG